MLALPLVAGACAKAAPEGAAEEEIAALEAEIDELEGDVTAKDAEISDLEDEIATLRAPAEVYEWRLCSAYGGATAWGDFTFGEELGRASGGRIDVAVFSAGELIGSGELLDAVGAGTMEFANCYPVLYPDLQLGAIEVGLPLSWQSTLEADMLWEQWGFSDLMSESYMEHNAHYLGPYFAGPMVLITTVPISSLDDLRKLKIRATAAIGEMLLNVGVATTYIPFEDIFLALETGTIDGAICGSGAEYEEMGFQEAAPYYCTSPIIVNPLVTSYIINQDAWDELPDDLNAIVESVSYDARWRYGIWAQAAEYAALERAFKGTLTSLPPEDMATLTEMALAVWEEEAAKSALRAEAIEILKDLQRTMGRLD